MKKIIAILGAGPSGLVSAKYLKQEGLEPLVLEQRPEIGGIWNPNYGSMLQSMKTSLSKNSCSFVDFPWSEEAPMFPSSNEVFNYLVEYTKHFNLSDYIHLNSKVLAINYSPETSCWKISWEQNGIVNQQDITYVLIATGESPYLPRFVGQDNFAGSIIHSKDYKDSSCFENTKALVVGGSITGAEIATELSQSTTATHLFNQQFWVLEHYSNSSSSNKMPIDLLFLDRNFCNDDPLDTMEIRFAKKNTFLEKLCFKQQVISELKIEHENFNLPTRIVINDNYLTQVQKGSILPKKATIIKFKETSVCFSDGTEESFDTVIMATGFKTNLDYLDHDTQTKLGYDSNNQTQPILLYKDFTHPDVPNMLFIGMHKGPYFSTLENQAQWASKIFTGEQTLPSHDSMIQAMHEDYVVKGKMHGMDFFYPELTTGSTALEPTIVDLDDTTIFHQSATTTASTNLLSTQLMVLQDDSQIIGQLSDN